MTSHGSQQEIDGKAEGINDAPSIHFHKEDWKEKYLRKLMIVDQKNAEVAIDVILIFFKIS